MVISLYGSSSSHLMTCPLILISTDHQEHVIKYLLSLFPLTVPYCASLENSSPISDLLSVNCNHAKYFLNWHMDEMNWEIALPCVGFTIQSAKIQVTNLEEVFLSVSIIFCQRRVTSQTLMCYVYWYRTDIQSGIPVVPVISVIPWFSNS